MGHIAVIGLGYVGAALCVGLGRSQRVIGVDKNPERVAFASSGDFSYLGEGFPKDCQDLDLAATDDLSSACLGASVIFLCVNTDYDELAHSFDVSHLEKAIEQAAKANAEATIVIRSTVPLGFTKKMQERHPKQPILFSPEFLREEHAYDDLAHPSRIIVGGEELFSEKIVEICSLLNKISLNSPVILTMSSLEAEAVKLFSNAYLALRVAYFNELDSLALSLGIPSENVIKGVSLDPRIGDMYNRPSFGYGGYCLPKDSKQLRSSFSFVPQALMDAIVESNRIRKEYLTSDILHRFPPSSCPCIGLYRLCAKKGSKSLRSSPTLDLAKLLSRKGYRFLLYEPNLQGESFEGIELCNNFESFVGASSLILADRYDEELLPVAKKVYTRDNAPR